MMRRSGVAGLVAALALSASARAQEHEGHHHDASPTPGTPIAVTINPEARVSAAWFGPTPAAAACGSAVRLPIVVNNQGYVTAPLQARLLGLAPPGVTVGISRQPLKGTPSESRALEVSVSEPGPFDITVEFSIPNEQPALGGRGLIHFVLTCNP